MLCVLKILIVQAADTIALRICQDTTRVLPLLQTKHKDTYSWIQNIVHLQGSDAIGPSTTGSDTSTVLTSLKSRLLPGPFRPR